jgi:uncharacterized protein
MNQEIEAFVQEKRVALVGVSRSGKKFGNSIMSELKQRGYDVYVVHPQAEEIGGERCYPSLSALQGKAGSVLICVSPKQAGEVLREAAGAGFDKIWVQQGADSPEVKALASELGIRPVTGKCILMYAPPVKSIHGFHRAIAKLIGQY